MQVPSTQTRPFRKCFWGLKIFVDLERDVLVRERIASVYEIVETLSAHIDEIKSLAVVTFAHSGEVHTLVSRQGPPLTAFAGLLLQQISLNHAHQSVEDGDDLAAE